MASRTKTLPTACRLTSVDMPSTTTTSPPMRIATRARFTSLHGMVTLIYFIPNVYTHDHIPCLIDVVATLSTKSHVK